MNSNFLFVNLPLRDSVTTPIKTEEDCNDEVLLQSGDDPLQFIDEPKDSARKYYGHLKVNYKDLWMCDHCPEHKFTSKKQLTNHLQIHEKTEKECHCPDCNKLFDSKLLLQQHIYVTHVNYRPHKCDLCEMTFHKLCDLKQHKTEHSGEKNEVINFCEKKVTDKSNLNRRQLKHAQEKTLSCTGCGTRFRLLAALKKHNQKFGCGNGPSEESSLRKNHSRVCGMTYPDKKASIEHCVSEHTASNNEIQGEPSAIKRSIKTEDDTVDNNLAAEDILPKTNGQLKTFSIETNLSAATNNVKPLEIVKNRKYTRKENGWTCDECPDQKFTSKKHLTKHRQSHRPMGKETRCPECSRIFDSNWRLRQHIYAKHVDYRPHKCDTCEKAFYKLSDLKKHMAVHSGEKKHVCSFCEKKFTDKSNLNRHLLKHSEEKPFCCLGCGSRFRQLAALKKHNQKYECGNEPSEESALRKHYCRVCGMTFQTKKSLTDHCVSEHTVSTDVQEEPTGGIQTDALDDN